MVKPLPLPVEIGGVKLWDWQKGNEQLNLKGHNDSVLSVNFSPDGTMIASGSQDQTVKIMDN
jgi:WD40 repeat protein